MGTAVEKQSNSFLKSLRMAKGMTLRQVAEACGISFMTVSYLERGQHAHGSKAAVKLLRFYGVETDKALRDLGVCPCCSGSGKPEKCPSAGKRGRPRKAKKGTKSHRAERASIKN